MIECYPVIYTRTSTCDYFANFHARHNFLNVQEARTYILSAMESIDTLDILGREIVFSNNEYSVFGILIYTSDLINKCKIPENEKDDLKKFAFDCNKRRVYGFFGFALSNIKKQVPKVRMEDYLNIFKEYIIPAWNQIYSETKISNKFFLDENNDTQVKITPSANINGKIFYDNQNNLFNTFIYKALYESTSFCSNIMDYQQIKNSVFCNISTTNNNIRRYLRENPEKIQVDIENVVSNNEKIEPIKSVNLKYRKYDKKLYNSKENDIKREHDCIREKCSHCNYDETKYSSYRNTQNVSKDEKKSKTDFKEHRNNIIDSIEHLKNILKSIIECVKNFLKSIFD